MVSLNLDSLISSNPLPSHLEHLEKYSFVNHVNHGGLQLKFENLHGFIRS
jgi:hypothetical protein